MSGSTDLILCLWSVEGKVLHTWPTVRASDLAVSRDGKRLVVACHSRDVQIYDLVSLTLTASFAESASITSISLSADGTEVRDSALPFSCQICDLQFLRPFIHFLRQQMPLSLHVHGLRRY